MFQNIFHHYLRSRLSFDRGVFGCISVT